MKRFFMVLWMTVMIPYVTTLVWTGRIRTDTGTEVPAEEFLTGVVAAEIPAEYGIETLKAQAVLARTYIYRLVDPGLERIREEELDIDCLSMREMEKRWGKEHFREYYGKIRTAVQETEGLVAEYDGELIEPFYCEASAGKTRELAAYPYIRSVESPGDLGAGEFLCVRTFTEAGRANDPLSGGCNRLIQGGANMLLSPSDVLEFLGMKYERKLTIHKFSQNRLAKNENLVYASVDSRPRYLEEIAALCGLSVTECMEALLKLELAGLVFGTGNQYYKKAE